MVFVGLRIGRVVLLSARGSSPTAGPRVLVCACVLVLIYINKLTQPTRSTAVPVNLTSEYRRARVGGPMWWTRSHLPSQLISQQGALCRALNISGRAESRGPSKN